MPWVIKERGTGVRWIKRSLADAFELRRIARDLYDMRFGLPRFTFEPPTPKPPAPHPPGHACSECDRVDRYVKQRWGSAALAKLDEGGEGL